MTDATDNRAAEYRICWTASSNISFKGQTEWREWDPEDGEPEEALCEGTLTLQGLEEALDASGFDWWVETR